MLYSDPEKRDFPSVSESPQQSFVTRILEKGESELFKIVTAMHNTYWEEPLRITAETFEQWVSNGIVFSMFYPQGDSPIATLACTRLSQDQFDKVKTYKEATAGGTLENFNQYGNILIPFAITVATTKIPESVKLLDAQHEKELQELAETLIDDYAHSRQDYVLRFHQEPKGGLPEGATIGRILPQGRPEDISSMGYNVTMEYSELKPGMTVTHSKLVKPSIYVVEEAMMYAFQNGISRITAFSRPAGFRKHLLGLQG